MLSQQQINWSPWLRVLGVVVALGAPFTLALLEIPDSNVYPLLTILVGVVSAGLLRSWWSLLIVPAAFSLGLSLYLGFGEFFPSLLSPIILINTALVEIGAEVTLRSLRK